MGKTLSAPSKAVETAPSGFEQTGLSAVEERVDWALCCFSFATLLSGHWMATRFPMGSTAANLFFLLPWALIAARTPNAAIGNILSNWPILALPLFAILSTAWSESSEQSLRGGAQYLITAIVGVLAASCVKPRTMLSALLLALAVVTTLGGWSEEAKVSLFGSKNYFGLSAALLLFTSAALAFDTSQRVLIRTIAVTSAAIAPVFLVQSGSTGALVCSVAATAITGALALVIRFAPKVRFAGLLVITPLAALLTIMWLYIGDFGTVLGSVGKDTTLTGRTWLWEWADMAINERPILGAGYEGFWQAGSWRAEEIWLHEQKADKTGYHFHNTYLQVTVDLGFIGFSLLLATIAAICIRIWSCVLFSRPQSEQYFAIAAFLFLLFRSPIEVDLFWQFQIPTVVLSMTWVYLRRRRMARYDKVPASARRLRRAA